MIYEESFATVRSEGNIKNYSENGKIYMIVGRKKSKLFCVDVVLR